MQDETSRNRRPRKGHSAFMKLPNQRRVYHRYGSEARMELQILLEDYDAKLQQYERVCRLWRIYAVKLQRWLNCLRYKALVW